MGEVYRARDTQLGRDVALKVLPALLVSEPDRVARLLREAQTLASLNHPNIGGIHGLQRDGGLTALVLELVEGPTLADRIAQGPLPVEEALPIAQQIAAALEAAHDQGIIHRDVKPANVKLRPDGAVKVLDFGLAKVREAEPAVAGADSAQAPTITTPAVTRAGIIMGTAAYMSPEQARGRPLDKRADVWAFGCVLYEMLTGRRPFPGSDVSDVIAAVLLREPDFTALPAGVPLAVRRVIERCLQKNPADRLRDVGDARLELRDAFAVGPAPPVLPAAASTTRVRRERLAWLAALAVVTLIAILALVRDWRRTAPAAPELRVEISTPPTTVSGAPAAISPDGRRIVFVALSDGQLRLWLRALDSSATARPLPGTEGALLPFWSPDSRFVGFFAGITLKRVDIEGGTVRTLATVHRATGGSWGAQGDILFSSLGNPIARVGANGGTPEQLSGLVQQGSNFLPAFLPDGRRFLYYVRGTADIRGVYVGRLDGPSEARRLVDADSAAAYAPSGHLLFGSQRVLLAQPFDPDRLQLTGDPFAVSADCPCAGLSVSTTGAIVYRTAPPGVQRQFVWFDRNGREIAKVGRAMSNPSLSRDGERVVGYTNNPVDGNVDVWMLDLKRGASSRLTSHVADDTSPVWSPDGGRIVFGSNRNGVPNLFVKPASPAGREELLLATDKGMVASDWSLDGKYILFESRGLNRPSDIWAVPLDREEKPFPVSETPFSEVRAQFSPDGRWVAYQSDESGRHEIYVQPFRGAGTKLMVSTNGGAQPRWRRDGTELFYVGLDGRLMAVRIELGANGGTPKVTPPVALFTPPLGGVVQQGDLRHYYVVSADGTRFLVAAAMTETITAPLTLILNWKPQR